MLKQISRKGIPLLILGLLYFWLATPSDATKDPAEGVWQTAFNEQVEQWVSALQKDAGFAAWAGARYEVEVVGPGTHQWLVTFKDQKTHESLGYMIVGAKESSPLSGNANEKPSFLLLEYGLGDEPLFDREGAFNDLLPAQAGVTDNSKVIIDKWYGDAFHAFWKVQVDGVLSYFDAKSGEQYPIHTKQAEQNYTRTQTTTNQLAKIMTNNTASDAYQSLSWMKEAGQEAVTPDSLKQELDQQRNLTYVASLYENQVLAPFSVVGYHQWDGTTFIALSDEGTRYIPFEVLTLAGEFK